MNIDIIYVTYNSSKWIENNMDAILKSNYDLKKLNIYIVDNASTDNTVDKLFKEQKRMRGSVGCFEIIQESQNLGFGNANNLGASKGNSPIVCFFNIDTEVFDDTFNKLVKDIEASAREYAVWELRQFPYEHPKMYNPLTRETSWCSGAAFAIRREVFEQVSGFDEKIFMYAEDVDLSWRIRSFGYKLRYTPQARIMHYAYQNAGEIKPTQYVNSILNNLLLRERFGTKKDIQEGELLYQKCLLGQEPYKGARTQLKNGYNANIGLKKAFQDKSKIGDSKEFKPLFLGFDYSDRRLGDFYYNRESKKKPLVSVIVRTCGRPSVLRETLISLRNQTYENFEIIIVEDGQSVSEAMIQEEFADLNIIYRYTGEKKGRSKAGNIAMQLANGKYLNFLDDDDLFFADHIEILVNDLEESKNLAAYTFAFETPIEIISKEPYCYKVQEYKSVHTQKFDRILLCHHNYIPIQCIMFEKSLFEKYGGLDESLDALEDWDLWVRYACHTSYDCIEKTTSLYRVPSAKNINEKRQKDLDQALEVVREKHKSYKMQISVYDLAMLWEKHGVEKQTLIRVSNLKVIWWNIKRVYKILCRKS